MKKVTNILLLIIFLNYIGMESVKAGNPYAASGPYGTNCTWYAWKIVNEKTGISLPGWGNAKNWYQDAQNSGYSIGTTPKANSIIVWGGWTSYGHVGYVESVKDNIIYVWDSTGPCIDTIDPEYIECQEKSFDESSSSLCVQNAKPAPCEYTLSPDEYGITGYIYLDEAPKYNPASIIEADTKTNPVTSTPKKEMIEEVKSNNNLLSTLSILEIPLSFDPNILEYHVEVEHEVDTITLEATTEDETATVQGTGVFPLEEGINEFSLLVTAEDGTERNYIVRITRNEKKVIEKEVETVSTKTLPLQNTQKRIQEWEIMIILCLVVVLVVGSITIVLLKKKYQNGYKS